MCLDALLPWAGRQGIKTRVEKREENEEKEEGFDPLTPCREAASGEDRRAVELYIAGVRGWEPNLRRLLDTSADGE
jgi:hypothetical protein